MKDNTRGAFTLEMMKIPQATWIETFLEGVVDKSTRLPIFKELVWFVYKVSGVMCSASACEHCWSIEGWIHTNTTDPVSLVMDLHITHDRFGSISDPSPNGHI